MFSKLLQDSMKQFMNTSTTNDVYKALESEDLSDVVMTWYRAVKDEDLPILHGTSSTKRDGTSEELRKEGNQFLSKESYQLALMSYNQAMMYAANKSKAMALAISNRSALFHKFELYAAGLKDVELCLTMDYPKEIKDKLMKRKDDCKSRLWQESMVNSVFECYFVDNFFNFEVAKNPKVPCVISALDIEKSPTGIKAIANKEITAGTVVAIEKAFVCQPTQGNKLYSCYYCMKMTLNLLPCNKCTAVLFCNEICLERCTSEYHNIECNALLLTTLVFGDEFQVSLKAALKMRNSFKSWPEFIFATDKAFRLKNDQDISELCNSQKKLSALNFNESPRKFGKIYNKSIYVTVVLTVLENANYFPSEFKACREAIKSFSRVLMKLACDSVTLPIFDAIHNGEKSCISSTGEGNVGLFSFAGKLKHCCKPNLITVGLNDRIALIALENIKPGTELTISYNLHWLQRNHDDRATELALRYKVLCDCFICTTALEYDKSPQSFQDENKFWNRKIQLSLVKALDFPSKFNRFSFNKLAAAMNSFKDLPETPEYYSIIKILQRFLINCQFNLTRNVILSDKGTNH